MRYTLEREWSKLDHAAVNHQLGPDHELGLAGGQVEDGGGAAGQERDGLLDGEEGTLEVGRHRLVEELFGHSLEGDESPDAGVDEQRVNPTVLLLDLVHRGGDLRYS